jgi:hypothetical protein
MTFLTPLSVISNNFIYNNPSSELTFSETVCAIYEYNIQEVNIEN